MNSVPVITVTGTAPCGHYWRHAQNREVRGDREGDGHGERKRGGEKEKEGVRGKRE